MESSTFPGQLARTRRFTAGVPEQFTVTCDGAVVLFLRSRAGDNPLACLWALDLDTGTERLLADPIDLCEVSGHPAAGIEAYATDRAARLVAFALAGELWTVNVAAGMVRRLPAQVPVTDPCPDPAGQRVAYVCDGALRVVEASRTADRAIAVPDSPDVTFGLAKHTGDASLGGAHGFWWAPDGTRLLLTRVNSAAVALRYLADLSEPADPPRTVRYASAGTANEEITLWVADLGGGRTQARWDRAALEYLPGAGWDDHGPYAVVQSRDQRTVRFLAIDPDSGQTTVLAEQRDERWVQLIRGLPARTRGGALVAHVDRHATRHLTVDGAVVTPPGLQVRAVLAVDGDDVLFTASADPAEVHLWRYRAGDGARQLSKTAGVHTGTLRGGTLVHVTRDAGKPGGRAVAQRAGGPTMPITSVAERPVLKVREMRLTLGRQDLRAALYLPSWHRTGHGPLPVVVDSYGGASRQRVTAERDWRCLVSQWFADQGFAVLVTDGRGTPGRGPDWEREVHGDLFGPVLDDQVTALRGAARVRPELDLGRVGIRGWSFGGSVATLAVLRRPDVFHAAVAGAGVTDQLLYSTHGRERFLGHPGDCGPAYDACSLVREAPTLSRPLLLMHGLADDNVHPANTLRLSSALLAAGRPHELLLLPGVGHQAMGTAVTESLLRYQADFLRRHLGGPPR